MAEAVAEAVSPKGKQRSLGKMLLLAMNVLLFLAGAAFFLLTKLGFLSPAVTSEHAPAPHATKEGATAHTAPEPATATAPHAPHASGARHAELVTVHFQPFVVNLSGDNGRRYLRTVIQLQVKGDKAKEEIEKNLGQMRNRLLFLLSSKTFEDIGSIQGKYQLQEEISKSINEAVGTSVVEKTYFTEFVVQ
jgi:flagellar protein FliL